MPDFVRNALAQLCDEERARAWWTDRWLERGTLSPAEAWADESKRWLVRGVVQFLDDVRPL